MIARAQASVWWPGLTADIEKTRQQCSSCDVNTPTQPAAPPTPLPSPQFPFDLICSDYFTYGGHKYLVIVDRFSSWICVNRVNKGEGAETLVKLLRQHFMTYGVCSELASDGGLEYVSNTCQTFLRQWGVKHRLSSAFHPHSNARSEVAVRQAKRMIRENTDKSGTLDTDKFARALLNYRNTPLKDIGLSPAQIIFSRPIRDHLPIAPGNYKPRAEWILTQEKREEVLARRYEFMGERLKFGTKVLTRLHEGNIVSIQNQVGPRAKKWDKTGVVVEVLPFDQYRVKVDGSGRITLRNRQFLRKIGQGDSTADNTGIQNQSNSTADTMGKDRQSVNTDDTTGNFSQSGNTADNTRVPGQGNSNTDTSTPTQPLDTLDKDGAAWGGGVIADCSASAASLQHMTRASYSDVLKNGLQSHHLK